MSMSEINALEFAADQCRRNRDNFMRWARAENWKLRRVEKMLADEIAKNSSQGS